GLAQALVERAKTACEQFRRIGAEKPDHRHRCLLRAHYQRPRRCRAAEKRDNVAPPDHSITSSAANSSSSGTSMPSALAVVRLMTNLNLVGRCTGRSPTLAPLRMRST